MDYTDFADNKILKVIPGKLTKLTTGDETANNLRKSISSTIFSSALSRVVPARLKLNINQVKFTNKCMKMIGEMFKGEVYIKLRWNFMSFQEVITSSEKLQNNKINFNFMAKYDLDVEEDFLIKLNENPLCFSLYAVNSKGMEVFLSQQQCYMENLVENVNVRRDVNVMFTSSVLSNSDEIICNLDIWYKFSSKQKSLKALFANMSKPKKYKKLSRLSKLSEILDGRVLHRDRSVAPVNVSESEIDHFADGLLLVLNRNKVLKTTQSDINVELEERVRWLRFEANWKQTLQENAILHGRDPDAVLWRQWREEDTANVRLRTYHNREPSDFPAAVSITIVKLMFFDGSAPARNAAIVKVYVEYTFLNFTGPEMETPLSLAKPPPNEYVFFNFKRTFSIDSETHYDRCCMLADLIKNDGKIQFMVISEPVESLETPIQTCYDIGYAEVLLSELIQLEENVDEFEYEIVDVKNPIAVVGYLTINVEGILAMRKMALDILAPKGYELYM